MFVIRKMTVCRSSFTSPSLIILFDYNITICKLIDHEHNRLARNANKSFIMERKVNKRTGVSTKKSAHNAFWYLHSSNHVSLPYQ